MKNNEVEEAFNNAANNYDNLRSNIIPNMQQYYNTAIELTLNFTNPKILDLGAGTGILTQLLHNKHPQSEITLVDISNQMLTIAKNKFKNIKHFKYIEDDYLKMNFNDNYDIIISSLSIHHLEDDEKYQLYEKIFKHLNNGGIFINADEVKGPTKVTEQIYKNKETDYLFEQNLSNNQIDEILYRRTLDKPATLHDNIQWLINIGYSNVDVFYKYYRYFVLYGQKM